jgi:hypothetical protein
MMNGGPIAWQAKVQDSASGGGSQESEYKALYLAVTQAIWFRHLLLAMGYPQETSTIMFEDNQGVINFSHNPINQSLLKHVEVKYHVIRDYIKAQQIQLVKIDTKDNLSDMLTKPLAVAIFWTIIARLLNIAQHFFRYKKRSSEGDA